MAGLTGSKGKGYNICDGLGVSWHKSLTLTQKSCIKKMGFHSVAFSPHPKIPLSSSTNKGRVSACPGANTPWSTELRKIRKSEFWAVFMVFAISRNSSCVLFQSQNQVIQQHSFCWQWGRAPGSFLNFPPALRVDSESFGNITRLFLYSGEEGRVGSSTWSRSSNWRWLARPQTKQPYFKIIWALRIKPFHYAHLSEQSTELFSWGLKKVNYNSMRPASLKRRVK